MTFPCRDRPHSSAHFPNILTITIYYSSVQLHNTPFVTKNNGSIVDFVIVIERVSNVDAGFSYACQSHIGALGLVGQWPAIKRAYAEANKLCGNIIKVTPSSKVIGDMAQFMVPYCL